MPELREYTLGELIVNHSSARRPIKSSERAPGNTPYYGASGIVDWVDGWTHEGMYLLVSEDGENLRSRSTPVAFCASGRIWVNNHAHVLTGKHPHDTRFLQYALAITDISGYLTGSAQPKLSRSAMETIRLRLPEPSQRRAISEAIGSLDEKIAANDRICSCVDQLAAAEFARISLGSGYSTLNRVGDVDVAVVKPKPGGDLRYLDISAVGVGSYRLPPLSAWDDAPGRARRALCRGDTVWSTVRPNRRAHALVLDEDPRMVASTGLAVLTPRDGRIAGLYEATRTEAFATYLESVAEGSAYPAVRAERFHTAPIPDLDANTWDSFEAFALPLRRRAHAAVVESRKLAAARDELLPLLMSGKVHVQVAVEAVEGVL